MSFKVINASTSDKKNARMRKELAEFSQRLEEIKSHSKNLLTFLHQQVSKRRMEKIITPNRNSSRYE